MNSSNGQELQSSPRKRTNSITSFSSFNSTATTQSHTIPRGSSTNDLLAVDARFNKPARKHIMLKTGSESSMVRSRSSQFEQTRAPRIPRASSVPSIPHLHSLQQNSTQDILSVNFPPSSRKPSLQTQYNPYQLQKLQTQQQQQHPLPNIQSFPPRQNQYQQRQPGFNRPLPQQQRRHSAQPPRRNSRPIHDAPFTFPNGEVYIPRSKQRMSITNAEDLPSTQGLSRKLPLARPPHNTSPIERLAPPGTVGHLQPQPEEPQPQNRQHPETQYESQHKHSLTLSIDTNNSNSTSPSPSGASRANSSVHESTPASSVDDLCLGKAAIIESLERSPQSCSPSTEPKTGLSMIEELSTFDNTTTNKPEASTTDRTNDEDVHKVYPVPEFLISSAGRSDSDFKINRAQPPSISPQTLPNDAGALGRTENVSSAAPVSSIRTAAESGVKNLNASMNPSPSPSPSPTPAPAPAFSRSSVTAGNTTRPLKEFKEVPSKPAKKGSIIKRMFSKVFSRNNTVKNKPSTKPKPNEFSSTPSVQSKPSRTQLVSTPPATEKNNSHEILSTPTNVDHDIDDQFSFFEGDEDGGLNSKRDTFNSDDVLVNMFSKMSHDKRDQPVEQQRFLGDALNTSGAKKQAVNIVPVQKHTDQENVDLTDDEDQVITLNDEHFIEKLIEFGETSFPDLASPDLGQSQRKLMRSKSIERRKSIRSISSSSKEVISKANQIDDISTDQVELVKNSGIQIILTNQRKDPPSKHHRVPSILKKRSAGNISNETEGTDSLLSKKVEFTNQIFVNNTYPSYVYNRHSRSLTSCHLSHQAVQQMRNELNEFKSKMNVHEQSIANTQFFH